MMCGDRWLETGSPWEGDEMTDREQFEKVFPVPDGVYWHDGNRRYQRTADYAIRATIAHQYAWQAWQAARATPALPQVPEGMAIVPVECLEVAERAIHLLQFNTSKNAREYGAITDALNAVLAAKEKGE